MLVPLLAAAALFNSSPSIPAAVPVAVPAATFAAPQTTLSFTVSIPPIPSFGLDTLSPAPRRRLISLRATLTLDAPAEIKREEEDLVAAINTERTSRGLEPLAYDTLLEETACAHSQEMCRLNYFAHLSPTPGDQTPVARYLDELHMTGARQPGNALVGENIFYASVTDDTYNEKYAHQSLMASPGHRKNILEPRFTKVGVGVYRDPSGRFWVTEMFLRDS